MVERTSPFWYRYPTRYVWPEERQIIWGSFDVSENHEALINEHFFNYVAFTQRQMRYKNRRGLDPQVKIFLDQEKVKISPAWNLPVPNEAAAYKSLAKYGKAEVNLTEELVRKMNRAWEWTERHFYPYMGNSKVLSLIEAVKRLDLSSSSGFPFNREFPLKKDLFEKDPDIMQWLEEDWEELANDPLWTTIFSSSLKEELRPQEKIDDNSQRTFTAGAADATVQGNRLFVDQNEKMYAAHTKSSSSIGMSPLKGNWDNLYRKLNVFKNGYALDESQYDSSIRQFMIWGCAQFRWKCYAPEFRTQDNLNRVKTYYRNLIHTLILTPEGILVMKKLGMPSGCVSTVTDNTLILYTFLAFAWIDNCPAELNHYQDFEDNTAKALVGDDNTWTVSDEAHSFFNAFTVIETWKKVGITTTTDSMFPRPACELDFLSAHTVFVKGIAVPLYSRDKLMTSLLFAPQSHITPATSLQRCTNLLQIGWTDLPFRHVCRAFIAWLLQEYDDVLKDDPRWIVAKCGIMTDEMYFKLFTSRTVFTLQTQSYRETKERLITLDNEREKFVMSAQPGPQQQKKSRRARKPARGPKKGKGKRPQKTLRRQQPRRRRGLAGARRTARTAGGIGATSFGSTKMISTTIDHEEYIGQVSVQNQPNFNVFSGPIQPGLPTLFPWLSQQAKQWEKYRFNYLEFFFRREVSEFNPAGSSGKIIMSVDFDASDAAPSSKQQMEDTNPHRDSMACENISLVVPKSQMNPTASLARYIRTGSVPGATDVKTYDVGNLHVATQGITVNGDIGELRVKYSVTFMIPVLESDNRAPANNSVAEFSSSVDQALVTTVDAQLVFGNTIQNGLGAVMEPDGDIILPTGNYVIYASAQFDPLAGVMTQAFVNVAKNTVLGNRTSDSIIVLAAAGLDEWTGHTQPIFYQSNGADILNIVVSATFAGSCSAVGRVLIMAI